MSAHVTVFVPKHLNKPWSNFVSHNPYLSKCLYSGYSNVWVVIMRRAQQSWNSFLAELLQGAYYRTGCSSFMEIFDKHGNCFNIVRLN